MLELRPHQQEVVEKIYKGFEAGFTRQLLYAPTGTGKTEIAMHIMNEYAQDYKRCAMVLDRIVLVEQTSLRLGKYEIDHGVMQSGHWRDRPAERIQICSSQTLETRDNFPDIDLLIVDECHVSRKRMVEFIHNNPQMKVIGLTATPFTKGLKEIYEHVVCASTTGELVEKNWLCPLKVFIAKEIDMTGVEKVAGEWSAKDTTERGMQITGDVVSEWTKKTYEFFGKPVKTIVFCSGVDHGKDLVEKFHFAGYNFKSISYKEDNEYKRQVIEDFSKPDTDIHGLIATDILTRGFDVPDVLIGISARPFSKSFSSHVQQLGRVMRTYEGKEFSLWLDHSGNFLRFRNDWEDLYADGVAELTGDGEKAKRELTDREKHEAQCPRCHALWIVKHDKCVECGYEKPKRQIIEVSGELRELASANNKLRLDHQRFWSEILYYQNLKGFKDGWSYYKYKEKFGIEPKGLKPEPIPPSTETLNWIKSKAIAYAKGRARA